MPAASGGLLARLGQHPPAERDDEPGVLGQRDERVGSQQPRSGWSQRTSASNADRGRSQLDDRLVEHPELVPLDGEGEVGLEPVPGRDWRSSSARTAGRVLAPLLGQVHGHVGVAQQLVGGGPPGDGAMPMLALTCTSWPSMRNGRRSASLIRRGDQLRVLDVGRVVDQHGELVAAEAGGVVVGAKAAR